jgi:hypothetical protein
LANETLAATNAAPIVLMGNFIVVLLRFRQTAQSDNEFPGALFQLV